MIVRIIGSGLLGASLGLALRRDGDDVYLEDISPLAAGLAHDVGAGSIGTADDPDPDIVIVATPPDVASEAINASLERFPSAVVTDVSSVKAVIASEVNHPGRSRYVGSHPMAGRERAGAVSADADLFVGRPWVIVGTDSDPRAISVIKLLALQVGAVPVEMAAEVHDEAVARISHVPQLMSTLMAARLVETSAEALSLAGQGVRDVTRVAGSDPRLWVSILSGNSAQVAKVLKEVQADLNSLVDSIESIDVGTNDYTGTGAVARLMTAGNTGVARIPGKHGGAPQRYGYVTVLVPDQPGELGRLFTEIGDIGINIEDLGLEHSAGAAVGRARIAIVPAEVNDLVAGLTSRGWTIAETELGESS